MNIVMTLVVAVLGYIIAKKIKLPIPAMIGSMIFVGIYNIIFGNAYMPSTIKVFTQGISGIFIGQQMSENKLSDFRAMSKPLILLLLMFTVNTLVVGTINNRLFGIDITTSLLSSVSGGVTDMSLISIDLNANSSTVALLQTSRLIFTLSVFPTWIVHLTKNDDTISDSEITELNKGNDTNIVKLIFTILVSFAASYVGKISSLPAGSLMFSAVTIMVLNKYTKLVDIKRSVKVISQLFAGSLIATTINRETFINLPNLILPIIVLLVFYLIVNYTFGFICNKLGWLDRKSALFAASPAGASDMALIASDIGADLTQVGVLQVARMVYSVSVMPQLITLIINYY